MIEKVLIADDEPLMRQLAEELLGRFQIESISVEDGREAISWIDKEPFDLIISDIKMPYRSGLDVLEHAKRIQPRSLVILATAFGSIESAVEAMKAGAFDYLVKPFSLESFEATLERAKQQIKLIKEHWFFQEKQAASLGVQLTTNNLQMKQLFQKLPTIARSQASVFITGESGTGKEVIAGALHQLSNRATAPFVKINCAAIPESLLESELFGHEKGAFTGAFQKKLGRFELADGGTCLLDEVTEIPLSLQPKLLRAIQEQEFERVGSTRAIKVHIRFIATSNRAMQEAMDVKAFREDLFYRLNVVPIHLPPLRERQEDILPLAYFFLRKFCLENHKSIKTISSQAQEKLLRYAWPGNVRELANILERSVVLSEELEISSEDLLLDLPHLSAIPPLSKADFLGRSLREVEKEVILETLKMHHDNRTKTATTLGISIRTLRNKLQEFHLSEE